MIIKLNKSELFWSLINPVDVEDIVVILNESAPEAKIEFDKLPTWAKKQIESSVKDRKISTDEAIPSAATAKAVELKAEVVVIESKNKKKASKKVTAKAIA